MLKSFLLPLFFLGTVFLVVAEKQDDQLANLLAREERLEKEVEKLTDFVESVNASFEAKDVNADAMVTNVKADAVDEDMGVDSVDVSVKADATKELEANAEDADQDERIFDLVDLKRRHGGGLHELDSEEDVNDVDTDTMRRLERRPKNSPFFWGRRRRRNIFRAIGRFVKHTVKTAVRVVRRVVSHVKKIWGQYKQLSECLKNAASLARAAGDEEEYQRLSIQADEAERIEADEQIKKDMEGERTSSGVHKKHENVATANKRTPSRSRPRRSLEEDEADISLDELENGDQDEIRGRIRIDKSDAKPWWGRRRRRSESRRRTAHQVVKNVCKWVNEYHEYILVAVYVARAG